MRSYGKFSIFKNGGNGFIKKGTLFSKSGLIVVSHFFISHLEKKKLTLWDPSQITEPHSQARYNTSMHVLEEYLMQDYQACDD